MATYNFNGLNARDIANKIIEREEAYLNTDFDALSLEEKAEYISYKYTAFHPLCHLVSLKDKITGVINEARERAAEGDPIPLYTLRNVLALDASDTVGREEIDDITQRAVDVAYPPALCSLAHCYKDKDKSRAVALCKQALDLLQEEKDCLTTRFYTLICYRMLVDTSCDREEFKGWTQLRHDYAVEAACDGYYIALGHIESEGEEGDFWETVKFLLESYWYEIHGVYSEFCTYGRRLIDGLGCEVDPERAKRFFLDVYSRVKVERSYVLDEMEIAEDTPEVIEAARQAYRAQADNGDPYGYSGLILVSILQGDLASVETLCDEVITKLGSSSDLSLVLRKVYRDLRSASLEKERDDEKKG